MDSSSQLLVRFVQIRAIANTMILLQEPNKLKRMQLQCVIKVLGLNAICKRFVKGVKVDTR
jgi:hypothetical protein